MSKPAVPKNVPAEPNNAPAKPKNAPAEPKSAPAEPKNAPTEPKDASVEPKNSVVELKNAPEDPKNAPEDPKNAPVEPKSAPAEPKMAPAEAKVAPAPAVTETRETVLAVSDDLKPTKLKDVRIDELGGIVEGRVSLRKHATWFTFVLYDGTSEIQIWAWGDQWKQLSKDMRDDECYRITAFKTRKNNGGNNTTFHAVEIHLIKISTVDRILDADIPPYPFTKVAEIKETTLKKLVNINAIVYNVEPESESNPKTTRFVNIVDDTLKFITLRLRGDLKEALDGSEGRCVTLLNVKVVKDGEWIYRNVDYTTDTKVKLAQDSDRVRALQKWFDDRGRGEKFTHVGY